MRLLRRMKAEAALCDRARRHRRRLAGDAGDAGADGSGRHRSRRGGRASCCAMPSTPRAAETGRSRPAGRRQRLHRARHGQDGRLRAELFKRHRPDRLLRPGGAGARVDKDDAGGVPCAADARPGQAAAGAHRRRLRVSRRSAAAAGSGLDPDRGLGRCRAQLLRQRRPELGARRLDQGARLRRRYCGRRGRPAPALAVHLAQVPRLRRGRRHRGDEAPDSRLSRPRGHRGRGPQHQARPRRHPRDRILRADPAVDRRRPPSRAAQPRHAGDARRRWPTAAGSDKAARVELDEAYRFLRRIEHRLQMVADDQTHTLPTDREALERFARFAGFKDRDAFAEVLVGHLRTVQRHYARLFEDVGRPSRWPGPDVSPRTPTDRDTLDRLGAHGLSPAARSLSRRCGAGSPAAIPRCAANSPATSSPTWCRRCSTGCRARRIRTPPSPRSIGS